MSRTLEVWLDADFVARPLQMGTLAHEHGQVRFAYVPAWLKHPLRFALDPDLSLDTGSFHPRPEQENFRVFDDSSPDRCGQTLIRRREALDAKYEGRSPRPLHAWDFLVGVQDFTARARCGFGSQVAKGAARQRSTSRERGRSFTRARIACRAIQLNLLAEAAP